jgi:hypothetical protein
MTAGIELRIAPKIGMMLSTVAMSVRIGQYSSSSR